MVVLPADDIGFFPIGPHFPVSGRGGIRPVIVDISPLLLVKLVQRVFLALLKKDEKAGISKCFRNEKVV